MHLLNVNKIQVPLQFEGDIKLWIYNMIQQPLPNQDLKSIYKDLRRTQPNHIWFSDDLGAGQKSLGAVLKCIATIYPEVGYCQGMNFVVSILMMYMSS